MKYKITHKYLLSLCILFQVVITNATEINKEELLNNKNVSTILNEMKLTHDTPNSDDYFGVSISISGNRALIGVNGRVDANNDNNIRTGGAVFFEKDANNNWIQTVELFPDDGQEGDKFGTSVSLDGDRAIVGAYRHNNEQGAAYIFEFQNNQWQQTQKLVPDNGNRNYNKGGDTNPWFGISVQLVADQVVIGASNDNDNGIDAGAAYIFELIGGSWILDKKIKPSNGDADDLFARYISFDGSSILISSVGTVDNEGESAYIFEHINGDWTQTAELFADDEIIEDEFGRGIAIKGDWALVGAPKAQVDLLDEVGVIYIYKKTNGDWQFVDKVNALEFNQGDRFGYSIAIQEDRFVTVAYRTLPSSVIEPPILYIFDLKIGSWIQTDHFQSSDSTIGENFGQSISIENGFIMVGSAKDDVTTGNDGSAYVYSENIFKDGFDNTPVEEK